MHKQPSIIAALALLALITGCTFTSTPSLVLGPVGPAPVVNPQPPPPSTDNGYLEVFTATRTYCSDRMAFRLHTAYSIYTPDGARFKSVQNARSLVTPEPDVVALPPGNYDIQGWAEGLKLVRVPVVILSHRLTRVNIDTGDADLADKAQTNQLVRLPDGRIVGWGSRYNAAALKPGVKRHAGKQEWHPAVLLYTAERETAITEDRLDAIT